MLIRKIINNKMWDLSGRSVPVPAHWRELGPHDLPQVRGAAYQGVQQGEQCGEEEVQHELLSSRLLRPRRPLGPLPARSSEDNRSWWWLWLSPLSLSCAQLTHTALSIVCSFGRLDPKTCMTQTFHNNSKVITKFYKCQNWLSERAFKLDFELNICTYII